MKKVKYAPPIKQGSRISYASFEAGSHRGTIKGYNPPRVYSSVGESFERSLLQRRVEDLAANDWAAKSGIATIATNVVGTGLMPQSAIPYLPLGISRKQATEVKEQMEWFWTEWSQNAHFRGQFHFEDLQALGVRSLALYGEMLHQPVMYENNSRFALKIQEISPCRLCTPADQSSRLLIHDGVEVSQEGVPLAYWVASPTASLLSYNEKSLTSSNFVRIPAQYGHRKGIFHLFRPEREEQFRGISPLATGVKYLRHFNDALDYELVAQVMAASFPLFISMEGGVSSLPSYVETDQEEKQYYQDVSAGSILYGNPGEKPEILESKRPSQNFIQFCELIERIVAAGSFELPYEELTKDYSKTTYSSARAALLGAWRVYLTYRSFFVRHYCQPVYGMVMGEAYLRGYLKLPASAPDFYDAQILWCNAKWIGPARGYIDPVKEVAANIEAINNNLMTRADAISERGQDFDETIEQLVYEKERLADLGLTENIKNPLFEVSKNIAEGED